MTLTVSFFPVYRCSVICIGGGAPVHAMVNKWSLGDNFQGSVLSFDPVGPRTTTQLLRFSRKCFNLLSYPMISAGSYRKIQSSARTYSSTVS